MALLHYLQVYDGSPTPGSVQTLYTVPAGYRVVLRNVLVCNRSGSAGTFTMSVDSARVLYWFNLDAAGATGACKQWEGRSVFDPGDTLSFYVPSGWVADVLATGSIYSI